MVTNCTHKSECKIRVLFDARKIHDGGIGRYIETCIQSLSLLGSEKVQICLLGDPHQLSKFSNFEVLEDSTPPYSLREMLFKLRGVAESQFDLFHVPHYVLPYQLRIPSVVTIHDAIHLTNSFPLHTRIAARFLISSAIKRASIVLTVSDRSKSELLRLFSGSNLEHKILAFPNALSSLWWTDSLDQLLPSWVPDNFVVAVLSNSKPHKGVQDLLDAYEHVSSTNKPSLLLVGAGAPKGPIERKGVLSIGTVGDGLMRKLLSSAQWLVVPSTEEGFCYPAVEAKSLGTRVIGRPVGILPQICGSSDVVVSDLSFSSFLKGLERALSMPALRDVEGARNVRDFVSINLFAMHLYGAYLKAVNGESVQSLGQVMHNFNSHHDNCTNMGLF